jgi:hypothetical protein
VYEETHQQHHCSVEVTVLTYGHRYRSSFFLFYSFIKNPILCIVLSVPSTASIRVDMHFKDFMSFCVTVLHSIDCQSSV